MTTEQASDHLLVREGIVRNSMLVAGVIVAVLNAQVGWSQTSVAPPQLVVVGEGEVHISPDRASITLGLQTRASTAAAAGAENARKQRLILDTLRALGLQSDQLSTSNYNVFPEFSVTREPTTAPRVIGYTVTNTVRVDVRRIDDVSRVIDAALAKGANEMSGLQFYSSRADSARRVALAAAVEDARMDAEVLAKAAGGSLGQLLELSTSEAPVRPYPAPTLRSAMAAEKTPIEPGQQTLTVTVTARWAFAPAK